MPSYGSPDDISIFYKGERIPRLKLTLLYFWNSGNKTLEGDQIVEPIRFSFDEETLILDARVARETDRTIEFRLNQDELLNLDLKFRYLDPGDGARIDILHTSKSWNPILTGGRIKGVPKIDDFEESWDRWNLISLGFFGLAALVMG